MKAKDKKAAQLARFIAKAKELGVDESGKTFERALRKVAPPKKRAVKRPLRDGA